MIEWFKKLFKKAPERSLEDQMADHLIAMEDIKKKIIIQRSAKAMVKEIEDLLDRAASDAEKPFKPSAIKDMKIIQIDGASKPVWYKPGLLPRQKFSVIMYNNSTSSFDEVFDAMKQIGWDEPHAAAITNMAHEQGGVVVKVTDTKEEAIDVTQILWSKKIQAEWMYEE